MNKFTEEILTGKLHFLRSECEESLIFGPTLKQT